MASITVRVAASVGLHARPAVTIAEKVGELDADVTLAMPDGIEVNADSALMIMTLGAKSGDDVIVSSDDDEACKIIADLIASDLDA